MNIVLDSSVIAKWYLEEKDKEEALRLKTSHVEGNQSIVAPALILFELGNVFLSNGLSQQDFNSSIEKLLKFEIDFIQPDTQLLQSIFAVSQKYSLTYYDATYVAIAQSLKCDFVTADKKLVKAAKTLKFVKLL